MKSKLDNILSVISEDSVDAPSSSISPGGYSAGQPPANQEFTSLADLIKYKNGAIPDIGSTSAKVLGVPLQHILDELTIAYIHVEGIKARFKEAAENPVFSRTQNHIDAIKAQIKQIAQDLDKLSLDGTRN
jgi:hypothetical protein